MRTPLTTISAALGAILLSAALSGCSTDPEPIIEPSPSASPPPDSPTPSEPATTTPTPPEQESAKAFIRRWQEEAFAMQSSGDTSRYRAMTRDCESCDNLANSVEAIYEGDGTVKLRGEHFVKRLKRVGMVRSTLIFEYVLRSPRSQVLDANDVVEQRFVGGTNRYQVNVSSEPEGWLITSASRLAA